MTAFAGHADDSTSKATYDHPEAVAPADRLYGQDGEVYDPAAYTNQPGASARANGYPRAD